VTMVNSVDNNNLREIHRDVHTEYIMKLSTGISVV